MRYFRYTIVWSFILAFLLMGPSLLAQASALASGAPVAPPSTADEWGNSFLFALVSSWLMRWWREHPKLSGFTEATALKAQRLIGIAFGFVTGLGITFAFDQGTGQLVIGGLFWTSILHAGRQFLFQEFVYHSALKRSTSDARASQ